MACFHSSGIEPSAKELFMSTVRGLAIAPEPSLRRRVGISARSVDLEGLIFFNSFLTNSSLIDASLKTRRALVERPGLHVEPMKPPLIFATIVPK